MQFSDNLQLVSGVFWIRPLPFCRFQQQLTVEIQHCAKITSSTKLSFVRACCSQKHLPYTFEVVDSHASFSEHSSYGVLYINKSFQWIWYRNNWWNNRTTLHCKPLHVLFYIADFPKIDFCIISDGIHKEVRLSHNSISPFYRLCVDSTEKSVCTSS